MDQTSIFDLMYEKYKITKPIRLIEFFAGYGSQALALKYLGVKFEHWKTCEWAIKSIQAYKDIHFADADIDYSKDLTKEELQEYLFNKGISSNYNEPMKLDQIKRLNEKQLRTIYNNIQTSHNLVNIQQVKGKDLNIVDADKYDYILTYSFPCQDLSLAGKGKGMSDTTTRSGMLWEVERILTECQELGELPQILLMENVPQVHSVDNVADFNKWKDRLEELGYKNYFQDLIATDYGIPQTRNRCFMISILGDYSYTFPKPIPLKLKLKDMLEDNVEEKYFLSDKMIEFFKHNEEKQKEKGNGFRFNVSDGNVIAKTITTLAGNRMDDNFINETSDTLKKDLCNKLIQEGLVEEGDVVKHSYTQQILDGNKKCVEKNDGNMITLTTRGDCVGVTVADDMYTESERQLFTKDGNIKRYMNSDIVDEFKEGQMATTTYPNGYGHGPRTHDNSVALNTIDKPSVKQNLRIRKLTPRECFRLMGVKDEDYLNCAKNQSDASLYHLAGDSIVVNVLMAIFKELL